ncbi:putative glutamine amidotransferase-like protein YfeJ [uncultured Paludibacter sp.]|uniref:Putative glutamine amidotransferase-like protein YfeJ n=1 Tax=uncultured Paludibacter sp. TaxID=497635 RepID=A0A653A8B1_9BACT|nr:putative glutamine amidotransferase-like protein YfeJ [uncultured Paludibacter sp.]
MKIHFIIHESFESPGAIEVWAKNKNHQISFTRVYLYEKYPETLENIEMLIVMGGPQSPETTLEECPYFNAEAELGFIRKVIDADKKVLGVCLGAQMIGEAFGAKVEHSPNKEIGIFDILLTEEAKGDSFFSTLPEKFSSAHWHGDMPGLTAEAKVLAFSEGCPRQIMQYAPKIYGFQCHLEFTNNSIKTMIESGGEEITQNIGLPYVQTSEELLNYNYSEMNGILFRFLDYFEGKI